MKMKPAERNAIRSSANQAQREITRLEVSLLKFKPASLPHRRIESMLEDARQKLSEAKTRLAHSTQPN